MVQEGLTLPNTQFSCSKDTKIKWVIFPALKRCVTTQACTTKLILVEKQSNAGIKGHGVLNFILPSLKKVNIHSLNSSKRPKNHMLESKDNDEKILKRKNYFIFLLKNASPSLVNLDLSLTKPS